MTGGGSRQAGPSLKLIEAVVAGAMIALGAVVMWDSARIGWGWASDGPQSGYFPFYVGLAIVLSSAVTFTQALMRAEAGTSFVNPDRFRRVLTVLIPTAIYVAAIAWLGLYVASALFIAFFMKHLGRYGWTKIAAVAIAVPLAAFLMFELWFLVPLPKGPLETALGY